MADVTKDTLILPKHSNFTPSGTFIEPNKYFAATVGGKRLKRTMKNCKTCKHRFVKTGKNNKSVKCIKCEYRKMVRKMTRKNLK
jgi:hypothetical protein